MKTNRVISQLVFIVSLWGILLCFTLPVGAQMRAPEDPQDVFTDAYKGKAYSPYARREFPNWPLWGDTHLHTDISMDSGAFGNRLGLDEAYQFARGDEVTTSTGPPAKLSRPLDFLVAADHTDNMGLFPDLLAGKQNILADPTGKDWFERINGGDGVNVAMEIITMFSKGEFPEALTYSPDSDAFKSVWQEIIKAAEKYNDPGQFTAFIGFEWSSLVKGNNLHRVVLFRDDASKASQVVALTSVPPLGSPNPRDLWNYMESYEDKTGGDLLAIAHNGNLSNGIMFPLEAQYDGTPLDEEYVSQRAKSEPQTLTTGRSVSISKSLPWSLTPGLPRKLNRCLWMISTTPASWRKVRTRRNRFGSGWLFA